MQDFQNDSDGNRTRVTAVKGRCLNRLTMGPYFKAPQFNCFALLSYHKFEQLSIKFYVEVFKKLPLLDSNQRHCG